jgi:hypothetical protein
MSIRKHIGGIFLVKIRQGCIGRIDIVSSIAGLKKINMNHILTASLLSDII